MLGDKFCMSSFLIYNLTFKISKGPVAEWLGSALQKLLQRFESARDLIKTRLWRVFVLLGEPSLLERTQENKKAISRSEMVLMHWSTRKPDHGIIRRTISLILRGHMLCLNGCKVKNVLMRNFFNQNFISRFVVVCAGHFVHADGPLLNAKHSAHFNESKEICFTLLVSRQL